GFFRSTSNATRSASAALPLCMALLAHCRANSPPPPLVVAEIFLRASFRIICRNSKAISSQTVALSVAVSPSRNETPPAVACRGFLDHVSAIKRSRIEVAMDAEAEHPIVHIILESWPRNDGISKVDRGRVDGSRIQLLIEHVQTHVEVFRDIPLGTCADPPSLPIHVAAGTRDRSSAHAYGITGPRTEHGVSSVIIADLSIAAINRRPPARIPEMFVSRVDSPSGRQFDVRSSSAECAAVDSIGKNTECCTIAFTIEPIEVWGLEYVAHGTLAVVNLCLQVIALTDHRCINLEARTDSKSYFIISMARIFERAIIKRIHVVDSTHDLGGAPCL